MTSLTTAAAALAASTEAQSLTLSDEERQPCEVWTRVMGYHRPVSAFNHGKRSEYQERTCFVEPAGMPGGSGAV